jgi:hypothetical protein
VRISVTHPLDQFEKWFEAQPDEVRSDCAHHLLFFDLFEGSHANAEESFSVWIKERDVKVKPMLLRILTLREILTLIVFFSRGTEASWQEAEETHFRMFESFQRDGFTELARDVEGMVEKLPERSEMWIKASANWEELLNGALSNQALYSWFWGEIHKSTSGR